MKALGLALVCIAAGTVALPAASQLNGRQPAGEPPVVERPPRYRIEFIVFAHNRFDAAEEHFDIVPPTSQFAATDEPIPQRIFDEDARQALRDLIEGPIVPPPPDPAEQAFGEDELSLAEPELEAYLDPAFVEGPATRFLEPEELTLQTEFNRLERLGAYTPLLHGGWEQNGLAETDAVAIDLSEFFVANPRGTLRLHMSRYLHMTVDLAWRDTGLPAPSAGGPAPAFGDTPRRPPGVGGANLPGGGAAMQYYLFEQRRILRGELNYFDHPAFGLLLKITLAPEPENISTQAPGGPSA